MFELTNEEKERLRHFSGDKITVSALKKLFFGICAGKPAEKLDELAAERIAWEYIKKAFYELDIITPDKMRDGDENNPAV